MTKVDTEFQWKTLGLGLLLGGVPLVRGRYRYDYSRDEIIDCGVEEDWTEDSHLWDTEVFGSSYYVDEKETESVFSDIIDAIEDGQLGKIIDPESISSALSSVFYADGTFDDGVHEGENMIVRFKINKRSMVLTLNYPGMASTLAALDILPGRPEDFEKVGEYLLDRITAGENYRSPIKPYKGELNGSEVVIKPIGIGRYSGGSIRVEHGSLPKRGTFLTNRE